MSYAEIKVEQKWHRHIIGKNGSNISRIKTDTGTSINIPSDTDKSDIIRIEGSPEGVAAAKHTILHMASKMVSLLKIFFSFYLGFLIFCQLTLILQRRTLFKACLPSSRYAYWACRWRKIVCYLRVRHSKVLRKWNITCCLNNEFQSDPRIFLNSKGFERKNWRSSFCFWNLFKLEKETDKSRWKFGFFRKMRNHVI